MPMTWRKFDMRYVFLHVHISSMKANNENDLEVDPQSLLRLAKNAAILRL
jgi:hypothetical protein